MEATGEIFTLVVVHLQLISITGSRPQPVNMQCMPKLVCSAYTGDSKCSGQMTVTTEFGWLI